ncbi:MAG: aminotransferase class V-fold PLP-dependent enzyme, partial [Elusimicrobiaceae bacterium]|nr:aminotransferase class V-fold PLP-dependent enzyme [Elusimicrobiaceae bacterium]
MERVIYLDNNATTACAPEVFEAMKPFFCERYGNPSSIHSFGGSVMAEVENARRSVAGLLGADFRNKDGVATEIIFTSCGTESDNAAILSALDARSDRRKIVTSRVEHPAILALCKELARRSYEIVEVPVDNRGRLDMEFLKNAVDQNTAVVSVMWANNEIGN